VKTPEQMIALGEERLKAHIKTIGLFNAKAKNVIALSEKLVAEHGGEVPADRDTLVSFQGVGRKTANVVLNCAFGEETLRSTPTYSAFPTAPASRRARRPSRSKRSSRSAFRKPFRRHAHHWLILHGRYTCKARLPECWRCNVVDLCRYRAKVLARPDAKARRASASTSA
jgi:endonuclease-3